MASSLNLTTLSLNLRFCHSSYSSSRLSYGSVQLPRFNKVGKALRLISAQNISASSSLASHKPQRLRSLTVFAGKGYKMKTYKPSAMRFWVTGRGKMVRRGAGKRHLLAKKNTKRKLRLSKMVKLPEGKKYVILFFQNNHHHSPKAITAPFPPEPPKIPEIPSMSSSNPPPPDSHSDFQEKMLYLDSNGLDFFSLIQRHPPIITTCLDDLKSIFDFLTSMNFTALELCRIFSMCPEILTSKPTALLPTFTFLLREAGVNGSNLKRVINRRPRLLACNVETQLRPTLYFLQNIGISEVKRHTSLLSCSVEHKLIPRIEYFQKIGFSYKQTISMFCRFPPLFNYSIKENYEPKLNYFVVEMGRDLKEIKEFPQYFSFSLENRIKPRHQCCIEKGVCFSLPVLLKTSNVEFRNRLEVCCNSTLPLKASPLWCTENCDIE